MKRDRDSKALNKKIWKRQKPILLREGNLCPHCKFGKIKKGGNGDLECNICGFGRSPRRC